MKLLQAILCVALLAPAAAFAGIAEDGTFADLYYVTKAKLGAESGASRADSNGGIGYGLRGRLVFLPNFFAQAEYQQNTFDGFNNVATVSDTRAGSLRAGAGVRTEGGGAYAIAEFIQQKLEVSGGTTRKSGWGARAGVQGALGESVKLYGELGHTDVGDFGSGIEFAVGGVYRFVFAETRQIRQKNDFGSTLTSRDVRIGVHLPFGASQ